MKYFFLIIVILLVFSCIYSWVTHTTEKKKNKLLSKIDAMIAVLGEMENCINSISTADSITEYRNKWSILYEKVIEVKQYADLAEIAGTSLDSSLESISQMEKDYQWMLRDVIERMQKKVSKAMKTTFRNSREHKARIYSEFCHEIKCNCDLFDDETTEFANRAIDSVYRLSGTSKEQFVLTGKQKSNKADDISDGFACVDAMDGHTFEYWCAELLRKNGFTDVTVTKSSGDQGVDLLAKKDGIKFAIQCKCYASNVGNTPIQEVSAGKTFYNCQIGVVMTNRYFTQGAIALAERTGTLLWDRDKLAKMAAVIKE